MSDDNLADAMKSVSKANKALSELDVLVGATLEENDLLRSQVKQLRAALLAKMKLEGPKPRKLDEALAWVENDRMADKMAQTALAATEPGEGNP